MNSRMKVISLALVFLFVFGMISVPSLADTADTSDELAFGGTIDLPSVNGLPIGLHMPIVLLAEESAGHTLQLCIYDSLADVDPDYASRITYSCEGMSLLGESVQVNYVFANNVLNRVYCFVNFENEQEALDYFDSALAMLEGLYGEYTSNYSDSGVFTEEDQEAASCLASYSNGPHFSWSEDVMPEHLDFNSDIELTGTQEEGYTLTIHIGGGYCYPTDVDASSLSYFDARYFN